MPAFVRGTPFGLPPVYVTCPSKLIPLLVAEGGAGEEGKECNGKHRKGERVKGEGVETCSGRGGSEAERKDEGSDGSDGSERDLSEDDGAKEGEVYEDENENEGIEAKTRDAKPKQSGVEGKKAFVPASSAPINKKKLKRAKKAAKKAAAAAAAAALAAVEAAAGHEAPVI